MAKSILFKPEMQRAIVADRKTQTRRMAKLPTHWPGDYALRGDEDGAFHFRNLLHSSGDFTAKPRYQPGDVVYVKEAHRLWFPEPNGESDSAGRGWRVRYRSDNAERHTQVYWDEGSNFTTPEDAGLFPEPTRWRSPLHMPEWAARLWLKITAVRVERLQDISEADAIAEGVQRLPIYGSHFVEGMNIPGPTARDVYANLIDTIHGPGTWASNPWVWVYTFERTEAPNG